MVQLADRITRTPRKSYGMYEQAMVLEARGIDLIHMEFGRPVHDTPDHIKQAAADALFAGHVHYSDMAGERAFREALAEKLRRFNRMEVSPDEILVTNGLTQGSFAAFMALINPGDEVILLDPYYPQHLGKIEMAGGRIVTVPLDAAADFAIRADWIEAAVTPRTRMIVLVNPANPTGRVYGRAELEALAGVAIRHDLSVVSDEVYEYITYDGAEHVSIASLPGMAERTISLHAFTKAYAMDGWRLGYAVAPAALMPGLLKISTSAVTHVNAFIQYGGLAAVAGPQDAMEAMVEDDRAKRDRLVQRLNQMPGVRCAPPQGTIYAFPDITGTGIAAQALAERILNEAHVVVEAGSFYGPGGEGHLRLCFGSESAERLDEGMDRLSRFFNAL
ncbi:pyridoxal phosphate-dependent aminotransferase [Sphingomonas colocasiae]|uniref:aspartate transaminase n=1 Tax=Sphingomonas colocasiae TaxID=1848973 RepID=A0ABS7PUP6_9SPHN|nr:pyridoxal phosphate-dependent aminotransferase [Sphingomonas colocasiae]MBY8824998.1 pyridoxal phosphate-dependent aminotransferase [Sphingomonas colocasiae]